MVQQLLPTQVLTVRHSLCVDPEIVHAEDAKQETTFDQPVHAPQLQKLPDCETWFTQNLVLACL